LNHLDVAAGVLIRQGSLRRDTHAVPGSSRERALEPSGRRAATRKNVQAVLHGGKYRDVPGREFVEFRR